MAPKTHLDLSVQPKLHTQAPRATTHKINYISLISLKSLIQSYTTQNLTPPASTLTPQDLLDLSDHWDLLISDCFQEIFEKHLKCLTCSITHYNKGVEEALEGVRTRMERTEVLAMTDDDVECWELEVDSLVRLYWDELRIEGGCPKTRPQPGTLVDGVLVLDEWEEKVKAEWMVRMFGIRWWEHPVVTGKGGELSGGETGGENVVKETSHNEVVRDVAKSAVADGDAVAADEEDKNEEEEGGIATRILREIGMENYEYKGKEIDYGKTAEFERESVEAREARVMRQFGIEKSNGAGEEFEPAARKNPGLALDYDDEDDDEEEEEGGVAIQWD